MADEGSADTFEYPVNGRTLVLRKMTKGRIDVLQRYVDGINLKAKASQDAQEIIDLTKKANEAVWAIIESQFINAEDLEYVQMEIISGRIEENALIPILSNGVKQTKAPDDDAEPVAVKRPGRKAPAKKAAKKAAPTSRAKR